MLAGRKPCAGVQKKRRIKPAGEVGGRLRAPGAKSGAGRPGAGALEGPRLLGAGAAFAGAMGLEMLWCAGVYRAANGIFSWSRRHKKTALSAAFSFALWVS